MSWNLGWQAVENWLWQKLHSSVRTPKPALRHRIKPSPPQAHQQSLPYNSLQHLSRSSSARVRREIAPAQPKFTKQDRSRAWGHRSLPAQRLRRQPLPVAASRQSAPYNIQTRQPRARSPKRRLRLGHRNLRLRHQRHRQQQQRPRIRNKTNRRRTLATRRVPKNVIIVPALSQPTPTRSFRPEQARGWLPPKSESSLWVAHPC